MANNSKKVKSDWMNENRSHSHCNKTVSIPVVRKATGDKYTFVMDLVVARKSYLKNAALVDSDLRNFRDGGLQPFGFDLSNIFEYSIAKVHLLQALGLTLVLDMEGEVYN